MLLSHIRYGAEIKSRVWQHSKTDLGRIKQSLSSLAHDLVGVAVILEAPQHRDRMPSLRFMQRARFGQVPEELEEYRYNKLDGNDALAPEESFGSVNSRHSNRSNSPMNRRSEDDEPWTPLSQQLAHMPLDRVRAVLDGVHCGCLESDVI